MNLKSYIAVVHKEKKSDFGISFPDFPGCISAGKNLEEAKIMATEALSNHIELMIEDGDKIPEPTSLKNFKPDAEFQDSIFCLIDITPQIASKKQKFVRVNITLPEAVLELLDKHTSKIGIPRSNFISKAVLSEIENRT